MPQLIGTAPNQVPTNGDLGSAAYMDTSAFYGTGLSASFRNRIINGAMVIDQRNAGASITLNSGDEKFSTDRFSTYQNTGTGVVTAQQSSTAPTGFTNSIKLTTTTANASLSAAQRWQFLQQIEGYNTADLGFGTANAKTVTLSFWVYSSLTGTFAGSLVNDNFDRSNVFNYTISLANTWEQKTVTITGDTSGTWLTTTGTGIKVYFSLGAGTNYNTTAGAWASGFFVSTSGATSVVGTLNATWYVTGVQLEKGTVATPFEYRPYGTELALCQRYFSKLSAASGNAYVAFGACVYTSAGSASGFVKYPTTMRSSPTISYGGSISFGRGVSLINITGVGTVYAGTDSALWQPSGLTGGSDGDAGVILASNDSTAFISFSSEL